MTPGQRERKEARQHIEPRDRTRDLGSMRERLESGKSHAQPEPDLRSETTSNERGTMTDTQEPETDTTEILTVLDNGTTITDDIVGLRDIADRLEVQPQTAHSWRNRAKAPEHRDAFPEPDGFISNGQTPWWLWNATIVPWAVRTGRESGPK